MSVDYFISEKRKFTKELDRENNLLQSDPTLAKLATNLIDKAASNAVDAGYGGDMGDRGASSSIAKFKVFLDGIAYSKTGKSEVYKDIIQELTDPDYTHYLILKAKFDK